MTRARGSNAASTLSVAPLGTPVAAIVSLVAGLAVYSLQDVIIKLARGPKGLRPARHSR